MMRTIYLWTMPLAFLICYVTVVTFPIFPGTPAIFTIDNLPVSIHSTINVLVLLLLSWVYYQSWLNYRQVVASKHVSTTEWR